LKSAKKRGPPEQKKTRTAERGRKGSAQKNERRVSVT